MAIAIMYPKQQETFAPLFSKTKLVYVAHPLASDPPGNVEKAKEVCRKIAAHHPDVVPVCPLLAFGFLREPEDREQAFSYCLALLERCDELWLAGDWRNSAGCLQEKRYAEELEMVVREWTW